MADFKLQTPERKKHSIRTAGRKKFKKSRIGLGTSGTTLTFQRPNPKGARRRIRRARN